MPLPSALRSILPRLPIVDLVIKNHAEDGHSMPIRFDGVCPLASHLDMPDQPWKDLNRVTYAGSIIWDPPPVLFQSNGDPHSRLPLAEWSFKTLVVDLVKWRDEVTAAFVHPPRNDPFLEDVERIELHVDAQVEVGLRSEVEKARRDKPVDPVRERILPLIVFVGPDRKERKLLEADQ